MHCNICDGEMSLKFRARIMSRYDIAYYLCAACGYLCTEKPYWLAEAYSDSIPASDTGILARNRDVAKRLAALLYFVLGHRGQARWLDVAGGYGILTRLMRDYGFDFYWSDLYSKNVFARGFELSPGETFDGITAIEAIEHSEDPKTFVSDALRLSSTKTFVFTTEIYSGAPPNPEEWWYYALNTGQHVAFFQERTLRTLAEGFGLQYARSKNLHIFSQRPVPSLALSVLTGRTATLVELTLRRLLKSRVVPDHEWLARQRVPEAEPSISKKRAIDL